MFRTFRISIGLCPEIWVNKHPWLTPPLFSHIHCVFHGGYHNRHPRFPNRILGIHTPVICWPSVNRLPPGWPTPGQMLGGPPKGVQPLHKIHSNRLPPGWPALGRIPQGPPRPVFSLLLEVSSDYAQSITGQVTEVTCPVIGQTQPELSLSKW